MNPILPTPEQLEWARQEIGVIIHYDITVFEPSYQFRKQWGYHPDPKVFAPSQLDTDQWIRTAKNAGANYAVLVAKHCTGFCLWPTQAHSYSVKNSSYNADIVGAFVASCRKYGVKPGIYYSTSCNAFCNVDNPGTVRSGNKEEQAAYNRIVEQQLTELWSSYGELFEVWFDGGLLKPEEGGPRIQEIFEKYQPNAVKFQGSALGDKNNLRWSGTEEGIAAFDCWSTVTLDSQFDGTITDKSIGAGSRDGKRWAPAECDVPNRRRQWFWRAGEEKKVESAKTLMDRYERSVGRNANLLIGMVIDDRGLVPDVDAAEFVRFGALVKNRYANPLGAAKGSGKTLVLELTREELVDHVIVEEALTNGHKVDGFSIECRVNGRWKRVFSARVIGHKRIAPFLPQRTDALRLCIENTDQAVITDFSAYYIDDYSMRERLKLLFGKK